MPPRDPGPGPGPSQESLSQAFVDVVCGFANVVGGVCMIVGGFFFMTTGDASELGLSVIGLAGVLMTKR